MLFLFFFYVNVFLIEKKTFEVQKFELFYFLNKFFAYLFLNSYNGIYLFKFFLISKEDFYPLI